MPKLEELIPELKARFDPVIRIDAFTDLLRKSSINGFIDFIESPEGQRIWEGQMLYIMLRDQNTGLSDYQSAKASRQVSEKYGLEHTLCAASREFDCLLSGAGFPGTAQEAAFEAQKIAQQYNLGGNHMYFAANSERDAIATGKHNLAPQQAEARLNELNTQYDFD